MAPHTSLLGEGCAVLAYCRTGRTDPLPPNSRRAAPPICPALIFDRYRSSTVVFPLPTNSARPPRPAEQVNVTLFICRKGYEQSDSIKTAQALRAGPLTPRGRNGKNCIRARKIVNLGSGRRGCSIFDFATWGNSGIEPDKGKGISSPGTYEASLMCGLATMESGNGILCRTGRVVEADIDLRGGSDRIGGARGCCRFRSGEQSRST